MCRSMVDIQSVAAKIRRGKKWKIEDRKKPQGKNIMACPITQGGHNNEENYKNDTSDDSGHVLTTKAQLVQHAFWIHSTQ